MSGRRRDRVLGWVLLGVGVLMIILAVLHAALAASSSRQGHTWILDLVLAVVLVAAAIFAFRQSTRLRR